MAVFDDAVGTGDLADQSFLGISLDNSLSWRHTAKGSNLGALVGLSYAVNTATLSDLTRTVKYNGIAMTSLGVIAWNALTGGGWTEVFGFAGITPGKATVTASVTGADISPRVIRGSSLTLTGVDSFGAVTTTSGTGTSLSVPGNASAASKIVAVFGSRSGLAGFNKSQKYLNNTSTSLLIGDAQGTGSSFNFTATKSAAGPWSGISVVVNPADTVASAQPLVGVPKLFAAGRRLSRPGITRRTVFTVPDEA